ncbi:MULTISPECIES: glucose-1-phosphate cytidylyltransferase [Bosea]|uniref:glucose-1-phosphate cytidylyltransferase n=2 Tax=Boseaceae TaxID=2831100 RepID=UPI0027E2542A|nr:MULTISPECIES: glucose-1-phosphate cytidylyltransferase [Bosea]MDR6827038.1 glucose-1-phosphate cytidylyltransferase [Bosea robiniae]MDR7136552.1 glucose-1-phosphate cytidylyltransferase [Bosea sp. BE168]
MMKIRKAVILAGGRGTRILEESEYRPKPMIEIGGRPIIWHIMKLYSRYGINEFVVCLGYKGYFLKEYFGNYLLHSSDVTFDFTQGGMTVHAGRAEPWKVTLVDTGQETMTGGRLARVKPYLEGESFCLTYGDGVSDVPIDRLVAFHESHGRAATVTAVRPPGRFGVLDLDGNGVSGFREKAASDSGFINGGFFVLEPHALDRIAGDDIVWESGPMEGLARDGELMAYPHDGFWQPMDTLRDKRRLEELWETGEAPWRVW